MKRVLIIFLFSLIFLSCSDTETHTDVNNKFSIDIPKNWMVLNSGNEYLSLIQFADTTKKSLNKILFDVYWESSKTNFTSEFKKNMDSIIISLDGNPKKHSHQKINGFDIYSFDAIYNDSLDDFDVALDNRYLNKPNKDGTLFVTITRWQKELNKTDSIQVERIFNSLLWK